MTTRRSHGGRVVEASLIAAGLQRIPQGVSLVETAVPTLRPHRILLAQNAWTVLKREQFLTAVSIHSGEVRRRHKARRVVAGINLRRAGSVIVLSEYMASLVERIAGSTQVVPVTLPFDLCSGGSGDGLRPRWLPSDKKFCLVPGAVTAYKAPEIAAHALRLIGKMTGDQVLVLAGDADEEHLRKVKSVSPVPVIHGVASRSEMRWLLDNAELCILPSRLESLGFGLAEALDRARVVIASPIPAHVEVAGRMGRSPIWLSDVTTGKELQENIESAVSLPLLPSCKSRFLTEWSTLRNRLET